MPYIFLSYRRSDSQAATDRIYERLKTAFGEKNIFRDINTIPLGEDFRQEIKSAVEKSDVVLVIIGKRWLNKLNHSRLMDADDQLRIEIETALQTPGKLVIPVLVDGARMPSKTRLPDSLKDLTFRNASTVQNDPYFEFDIGRLIEFLRGPNASKRSKQPTELQLDWSGVFFPTTDLTGIGIPVSGIKRLDFNWGTSAPVVSGIPIPGLSASEYSARFSTPALHLADGEYEFVVALAGEIRLYLNGALLLEQVSHGHMTTRTFQHAFQEGRQQLVVEYVHRDQQLSVVQVLVRRLS
jgi:hypothetical protein